MRQKNITFILILIMAALASCEKQQEMLIEKVPTAEGVKIEIVKLSPVEEIYEAAGTVRSKTTTVLSSKIVGHVIALTVREGDRTEIGQLLIEVDARDIKAHLQKAQAGLREAQDALDEIEQLIRMSESGKEMALANRTLAAATFQRYRALLEERSVSHQEYDEVLAKNKVAEAEVERADRMLQSVLAKKKQGLARIDQVKADITNVQITLSYARISSPIRGVVTSKQADVGILAMPGSPLLTIEDDSRYRLEVAVEESQTKRIGLGVPVQVSIDALGPQEFASRVTEVVPASDPASRSYTVKIDLPAERTKPGDKPLLRSGLFGKARFPVGKREVLLVPESALSQKGQLIGVYAVDESGIARLRLIKTGKPYGNRIEVLAGIKDGDRIAVDHLERINEGIRVQ